MLLITLVLGGFFPLPSQDGVRDTIPLQPQGGLSEAVRASASRADPLSGGWAREDLAAEVDRALAFIAGYLEGGSDVELLLEILTPEVTFTDGVHGEPEHIKFGADSTFEGGAVAASDPGVGMGAFVLSLDGLRKRWAVQAMDVHFKILGVEEGPESLTTPMRMEVRSRSEKRRVGVTANIVCSWVRGESSLQLESWQVNDYAETASPRSLFVDRTAAALPGDLLANQLQPGIDSWREHLDAYLGPGVLGHHGLCVADVNLDGLEDLYLCQPGGLPNRLLLREPDGTFRDISARAAVDILDPSSSALLVDLDGDGDPDLVVVAGDELVFMENRGGGLFRARSRSSALSVTSLSAADVDLDGDLDLYACAYLSPYDGQAIPLPYHEAENGQRNLMLVNEGDFSFVDRTDALGLGAGNHAFSFAAAWEDYDIDGDPDLYVANDFGSNNLYRNDGGQFVDVARAFGVDDVGAGMGVDWADVDGDGWMDLYVSNMFSAAGQRVSTQEGFHPSASAVERAGLQRHARGNSLFLNRAGQGFEDVTEQVGVGVGRWAWGGVFMEFDNDGRPDLFVPNGFVTGQGPGDL
ncbi:MAG: VCBS repeat-containing protein [Planctomycetota bacterium]|nr:VCBS repeat-containing protein [Planctomycetota bacterium]